MPSIAGAMRKRIAGISLIALGALALTMPLVAGRWSLAILGLPLIALSIAEAYIAFTSPRGAEASAYLPSALAFFAGNVLLLSSALVRPRLLVLLIAILTVDGLGKSFLRFSWFVSETAFHHVLNGCVDLGFAAVIWYLSQFIGIVQAIGILVGAYIAAAGWRLLMVPDKSVAPDTTAKVENFHPDPGLGIPGNESFARLRSRDPHTGSPFVHGTDLLWMSTLDRLPCNPPRPDAP